MMKRYLSILLLTFTIMAVKAQGVMTPELLWSLGRVNGAFLHDNNKSICYNVMQEGSVYPSKRP